MLRRGYGICAKAIEGRVRRCESDKNKQEINVKLKGCGRVLQYKVVVRGDKPRNAKLRLKVIPMYARGYGAYAWSPPALKV